MKQLILTLGILILMPMLNLSWADDCAQLSVGNNNCEINSRRFIVYVPSSYDANKATPLVVDMHPILVPHTAYQYLMGWKRLARREGMIVAFPAGNNLPFPQWNAGRYCCGLAQITQPDDVGFIRDLVSLVQDRLNIDRTRIYATGYSNGGGMSFRLACEAADIFAAVAPIAQGNPVPDCNPQRSISVIEIRGIRDMPFTENQIARFPFYPVAAGPHPLADMEQWRGINQCVGSLQDDGRRCQTFSQCADDVEVTYCRIRPYLPVIALSHISYPFRDVSSLAWERLKQHRLPDGF